MVHDNQKSMGPLSLWENAVSTTTTIPSYAFSTHDIVEILEWIRVI